MLTAGNRLRLLWKNSNAVSNISYLIFSPPNLLGGDFFYPSVCLIFYGNNLQRHLNKKLTVMAEIEIKNNKGKHPIKRTAKKLIKVDLTPMVDLGFLLITFFVFTTTMAKATVMEIKSPVDEPPADEVCNSCALTVLLDKNDALYYYQGAFENAELKKGSFKTIRDIIQQQKQALQYTGRNVSQFSLIIKATDSASFRNFVDMADEVTINVTNGITLMK
jgi:biopolymer transport protein ExbD